MYGFNFVGKDGYYKCYSCNKTTTLNGKEIIITKITSLQLQIVTFFLIYYEKAWKLPDSAFKQLMLRTLIPKLASISAYRCVSRAPVRGLLISARGHRRLHSLRPRVVERQHFLVLLPCSPRNNIEGSLPAYRSCAAGLTRAWANTRPHKY